MEEVGNLPVLLRGNGDFTGAQYRRVMRADDERHLMLSLGLTTGPGCNMKCVYCYAEGGLKEAGRVVKDRMTAADYERAIKEAAALGAESVIIVGVGETTMDVNLPGIIETASREGMYPLIFTNGSRLDRDMAGFLYAHGTTIYLSLDSIHEDSFDRITCSRGVLPSVLTGIANCLAAGFGKITTRHGHRVTDFAVNAMVMKLNADHIDELEEFCRRRNILFTCRFPEKLGYAPAYWKKYIASDAAEEERLKAIALKHSLGGEVFRTDYGCLFWAAGVLLGIDGRARLCYSLNNRHDFGNIREDSLKEIIRKKMKVYPPSGEYLCPIHAEMGHPGSIHT